MNVGEGSIRQCAECGAVWLSAEARGWRAYLTADEDGPVEAILYCIRAPSASSGPSLAAPPRRELGYERRAVDAIFRACPVESWPGYSRPMIRVSEFLAWRERCTYWGDRVRPTSGPALREVR